MISKDLVVKAINKDSDAITNIYQDTYKSAYALAFSITKSKEDAEDMLQEAYIAAFNNIDKLKNQDRFDSWFNQIVANRCKNYLVKKKPALFSSMGNEENDGFDLSEAIEEQREEFQPEDTTETNEIKEIVSSILDELPEDQKLCMIMFYGQDMKIKEISHALSIPENTVKSRLMYGRKKMLELVKEKESKGYVFRTAIPVSIFAVIPVMLASKSIAAPSSGALLSALGVKAVASGIGSATSASIAAKTSIPLIAKIAIGVVGVAIIGAGVFGSVKLFGNRDKSETNNASAIESTVEESTEESLENNLQGFSVVPGFPEDSVFLEGNAGGSMTKINLHKDGKFDGEYINTENGTVGDDFPNGTIYKCDFTGEFNNLEKVDEYTYSMKLTELKYDDVGQETINDGIRYITTNPEAFRNKFVVNEIEKFERAENFSLFLPGRKDDDLENSLAEGFPDYAVNIDNGTFKKYMIFNNEAHYIFWDYTDESQNSSNNSEDKVSTQFFTSVETSSFKTEKYEGETLLHKGRNVLLNDGKTCWADGNEDTPGIGEYIILKTDVQRTINGLEILPGYSKNESVYKTNYVPTKIKIELSDGFEDVFDLEKPAIENYNKVQNIDFEKSHKVNSVKITILDVEKIEDSGSNDTCISYINGY